jgi:hypothetical protein
VSEINPARAIIALLKAPVSLNADSIDIRIGAEYGAPTTIRVPIDLSKYDIREGDILTLYTEVLLKGATNA